MQVPTNLSHYGIDSYAHQSIDKTTRTAYVAENKGVQLATEDSAEISEEARNLQDDKMTWLNITKNSDGKLTAHFNSSWQIARVLKYGYMIVNGKKITLTEQQQQELNVAGKTMERNQQNTASRMIMQQQLATARQQADAWKNSSQKQSRIIGTATRLMKGERVSHNDEAELMETCPELYSMAKSAAEFIRLKKRREDEEKARRVSEEHDRQRAAEKEPKDYSTLPRSAYPTSETQVTFDISGSEPHIETIGEVTTPPANNNG